MNILVFSWRDPKHPLAGGAEQVMHEHMKGWVKEGHEVTLFASYFKGAKKEDVVDGVEILRRGCQLGGVHISAFIWYVFKNKKKYNLVIDQFHGIPFFTPLYVRQPKLAVLQEITREVWFKNQLPFPFNWLIGTLGYMIEPLVFLLYKNVPFMVGSNSAKEELVRIMHIPNNNITIVSHGIVLIKLTMSPEKDKVKTITFLGALAKDKGIEDALQTFSILNKRGNFQFWVIGKAGSPYDDFLKNLVFRFGLKNNVTFWGFVDQKKKFELLAKSHILINPSFREGWGLVNIEANSVGIPVVAYSSPGLIDSVKNGESGILVKESSPEKLAEAIIEILRDEERYKHLQAGALSWSKNFSWKKSKQKSLTLINKIVNCN